MHQTGPEFREDFLWPALRSLYASALQAIPGVLRVVMDTAFAVVALGGMALLHRASATLLGEDATILGLVRIRSVFDAGHVAVLLEWARRQVDPWLHPDPRPPNRTATASRGRFRR